MPLAVQSQHLKIKFCTTENLFNSILLSILILSLFLHHLAQTTEFNLHIAENVIFSKDRSSLKTLFTYIILMASYQKVIKIKCLTVAFKLCTKLFQSNFLFYCFPVIPHVLTHFCVPKTFSLLTMMFITLECIYNLLPLGKHYYNSE